jgi:transcription antitermination factor NusG
MKTWYAVYTKKNCERKVIHKLKRNKIKYFFPLNRIPFRNNEKEPLFPSYVFIYTTEIELKQIVNIQGVINPVYWLNKPVSFAEKEIEKLIAFIKNHSCVEVKKTDMSFKTIHNEIFDLQKPENINHISHPIDTLAIPMLGVLLTSERILAQEFKFRRNQSFSNFLYRLGLSNLF